MISYLVADKDGQLRAENLQHQPQSDVFKLKRLTNLTQVELV